MTVIDSKQALSTFTRSHASGPITWVTQAGPGGTIIILDKPAKTS